MSADVHPWHGRLGRASLGRRPHGRDARVTSGFTLVESVISIAIAGGLLVVALTTAGSAKFGQYKMGQRQRGLMLAQELMAEITAQAYAEPVDTPGFGPEANEGAFTRAVYDDVDDYHRWASAPPKRKDGTVMTELTGWKRSVVIRYVKGDDFTCATGVDEGVKRIEISVSHNGLPVARLWAVRTDNVQQADEE